VIVSLAGFGPEASGLLEWVIAGEDGFLPVRLPERNQDSRPEIQVVASIYQRRNSWKTHDEISLGHRVRKLPASQSGFI
jgi:hypothetical protein